MSGLGRSLGYSYHAIQNLIDLLEGYFLVRRLQPWHANQIGAEIDLLIARQQRKLRNSA